MTGAVLNLVIFALLCRKNLAHPTTINASSTTIQPTTSDSIIEMGKGIETIPHGKPQIKILNLAYNHISSLPESVFHNSSYKTLTKIELYHNKINTIHPSAFRGLRQLSKVDLSDNNLSTIDPYVFKYNTKLEKVDLSGNRINFNRLQVFLVSQTIETLVLTENRIEQVYDLTFLGLQNLKNLFLDHNTLFLIAPNSFKPLNKLQYLSVANTGVYRLSESMFNAELPRIIDLQETPLAKRFDPPLTKITNNAVRSLINIDQFIFIGDTPL